MADEKMELRSTIKALTFKKSRLACKMAKEIGLTGPFLYDDLDFKRVNPLDKQEFDRISNMLYKATWKLDWLEDPERHHAKQLVFDILRLMTLDESKRFIKSCGCLTTTELVEKESLNPGLIEGALLG